MQPSNMNEKSIKHSSCRVVPRIIPHCMPGMDALEVLGNAVTGYGSSIVEMLWLSDLDIMNTER